jgi:hypothetical protein
MDPRPRAPLTVGGRRQLRERSAKSAPVAAAFDSRTVTVNDFGISDPQPLAADRIDEIIE